MQCYNFLAQRDNNLNVEVAQDSKIIALVTGRDSIATKTVAILTIAFLPGIFVAVRLILQCTENATPALC